MPTLTELQLSVASFLENRKMSENKKDQTMIEERARDDGQESNRVVNAQPKSEPTSANLYPHIRETKRTNGIESN